MKLRSLSFGVLLVAVLASSGCSKGNPLLGTWEIDEEASSPGVGIIAVIGGGEIEFLADKMMMGSTGGPVTYDIGDGHVLVTTAQGQTTKYVVVSDGQIRQDLPMQQKIVYRRVE